jgi:hypothetical protein
LFSALYGLWAAHYAALNGDEVRKLAAQFLVLAQKQTATAPRMIGHRLMGMSLLHTGDIAEGRAHFALANALYDPVEHRPLATRFGQDVGAAILFWKSLSLWLLGYPEAALADADDADDVLKSAREIGQAATLMYTLIWTLWTHILREMRRASSVVATVVGPERSVRYSYNHNVIACLCVGGCKALAAKRRLPSSF